MQYLMLETEARESLLARLEALPDLLATSFADLSARDARARGPDDAFSPVEHCWHLADLEREGYALRISRLRAEVEPHLADFDGARIARERDYRSLSLGEGLERFRRARRANVASLRALGTDEWQQRGTQEGVGPVSLCDVPAMMAAHDAGHAREIAEWKRGRAAG